MLRTPRQLRPWSAPRSSSPALLAARASHVRIQVPRHRAEAKKSGSTERCSADDATTPALSSRALVARAVANLSLAAALVLSSVSTSSALAFSGIPEPSSPPAVVTTKTGDGENTAPQSDGTLQIKFLASPDPEIRQAQTALVESWGKVSTMYFDHEFGGVDWRGALQEALDDSFRASTSSTSSSEEEKRKKSLDGTYAAIDTMLSKLGDPYTRVLRPADAGSYVAGAEGEGLSLGMQLVKAPASSLTTPSSSSSSTSSSPPPPPSSSSSTTSLLLPPVVAAVVPESPAARAGISAGDSLLAIDGQTTKGRPIEDLALSLTREADVTFLPGSGSRGKKGNKQTNTSPSLKERLPRTVHLKPASVSLHAVQWAKIKTKEGGGAVAYIRVAAFNRLAPSDVARALDSLVGAARSESSDEKSAPPPVLLLDLRDNSGGAVDAGVDVASLLLPRGYQSGGAKGNKNRETTASPPLFFFGSVRDGAGNEEKVQIDASKGKLPAGTRLAVLVNGGTASTSELVAAALRGEGKGKGDSSSALLVGELTFKKARTQRAVPLSGGGLLLVSNLQYISPRGESVDGVGLTPDVSCKPGEVERSFFVSGGGGDEDGDDSSEILAEDLLFDPCARLAAEALGAPLAEPTAVE